MHTAQIRANFAQNQPSKRLLRKNRRKSHLTISEKEGAAHGQRPRPLKNSPSLAALDSPLWDGAFGIAAGFPAKAQSLRVRQRLPPRGSWQSRQALTEGVRL